ncbi:MAG: hypothetical protein MUF48_15580, partial [Pirellulaceae bacterium]|nr:hypothetical protein [Pirellulaceae bacterium]
MIDWQADKTVSQLHAGTTSAGAGQLRLVDGTVAVLDDVTLNSSFTHTAGTLTGPATLTLAGPVMWDGGMQQGTESGGQTLITGGLEMTSGTRVLHGRTLVLQSDTQWTGG